MFFARLYHLPDPRARTNAVLDLVGMQDAADRLVKGYSGGMRKRLDLATGLLHEPALHIRDEPTLGLDVAARDRVWGYIRDIRERGGTVLLCTNYMDEADRLCDDIAIIDHGTVVARGTPSQLKDGLGGDVITLLAAPGEDGAVAWPESLASLDGVSAFAAEGAKATATVSAGGQVLPRLLEATSAAGIAVTEVEMLRPSLDAVFLHHTGRRLADGGGDGGGA
jgi:ABC-2 type transport system ATP-binding protein